MPNSNTLLTKNACSVMKNLGGKAWLAFTKGFNIPTDKCPLLVVMYKNITVNYLYNSVIIPLLMHIINYLMT